MILQELSDMIDKDIIVTKYANQPYRWSARIEGVEVKDGAILASVTGECSSPEDALAAYCAKIRGKRIAVDAMGESRIVVLVPKTLEY